MPRRLMFLLLAAPVLSSATTPAPPPPDLLRGEWRISAQRAAPWAESAPLPAGIVGRHITVRNDRIEGEAGLACDHARISAHWVPAAGLFQGGLPDPENDALMLGIPDPAASTRVDCDRGSFDYHHVGETTALVALDNVIRVLDRAPGATAPTTSPEGVVQALMQAHFARDMGFTPALADAHARWLSAALNAAIDAYFARDWPADEVPPINGDPFTDSQEYPAWFAVQTHRTDKVSAYVPVRLPHGREQRELVYQLHLEAGKWRVEDIEYGRGARLRALLAEAVAENASGGR